jgi:hypothetical protein
MRLSLRLGFEGRQCPALIADTLDDICQRLRLPYTTVEVGGIDDRDQALIWIEENQLGRRNLSEDQRAAIALSVLRRKSELAVKRQRQVCCAGWRSRSAER